MKTVVFICGLVVVMQAGVLSYFLVYQIGHRMRLYKHFENRKQWKIFLMITAITLFLLLFGFLLWPMLESILEKDASYYRV